MNFDPQNLQWLIAVAGLVAVVAFARFLPKEKIIRWTIPWSGFAARWLDKLLLNRLPAKTAHDVEEGVIITLLDVARANADCFRDNLLMNNPTYAKLKAKEEVHHGAD